MRDFFFAILAPLSYRAVNITVVVKVDRIVKNNANELKRSVVLFTTIDLDGGASNSHKHSLSFHFISFHKHSHSLSLCMTNSVQHRCYGG